MKLSFIISLIFTAVTCSTSVQAQEAEQPKESDNGFTWSINKPTELMFAQTATAMKFDGEKLTLTGVAPATTFFSDHPDRFVGHLSTSQFISLWNQNTKQYEADPPNASLSVLGATKSPSVVELRTVAMDGDSLIYEVRVLEGEIPKESGAVTLFIDPIMTPRKKRLNRMRRLPRTRTIYNSSVFNPFEYCLLPFHHDILLPGSIGSANLVYAADSRCDSKRCHFSK